MFSPIDLTDPLLDRIPIETREDLVAFAERRILSALTHARFEVDTNGLPVDATVQLRIKYAIVEQALAWHKWGVNPASAEGEPRTVASHSLGPATITYDHRDGQSEQRAQARDGIAESAYAWIRPLLYQPTY